MKEAQDAVYDALIKNDITVVTFMWVKYISDRYIPCGPRVFLLT